MNVTSIVGSESTDFINREMGSIFMAIVFIYFFICCCCIGFYHWYQRRHRFIRVDANQPIVITYPPPIYREKPIEVIIEPMPQAP